MMSFIGEWIKHIVLLILLASFLDLILPNSSMRKYVKLVVGFLLIFLILSPILQLFKFDHDRLLSSVEKLLDTEERSSQVELERRKQEIEALQDQVLLEEVHNQWEQEIMKGLEAEFDVQVVAVGIQFELRADHVEVRNMDVMLRVRDHVDSVKVDRDFSTSTRDLQIEQTEQEVAQREREPVKSVELVREVSVSITQRAKEHTADTELTAWQKKIQKEVLKFVQTEWNISVDKIHIAWSRG